MPFIQRGPTHDIPYLDIRLDEDVLVFRGNADESNGGLVKGCVALCVRETVAIKSITLVLQGVKRLQWNERPTSGLISANPRAVKHEELFFEKRWNFLESERHLFTIKPDNYEYPFQLMLDGDLPESVEGLGGTHLVYRLKARVVRGKFNHDITAKKHLRIVRTLGPGALELGQTMSVENIWPNKVQYSIQIPNKAVVFGTYVPIEVTLVPLLKGLTIGKVICQLKETHAFSCPPKMTVRVDTRQICSQTFTSGEMEEDSEESLGKWVMRDRMSLPKSLHACVQDCEVPSIKIRHKIKFTVQLHNPDGHMSELRASLPVMLFISPSYLMDETNQIPGHAVVDEEDELINAPPSYDVHYLDRLYENLPQDNFETPIPSGSNTPMMQSRNNSAENLSLPSESGPSTVRLPDANSRHWVGPSSDGSARAIIPGVASVQTHSAADDDAHDCFGTVNGGPPSNPSATTPQNHSPSNSHTPSRVPSPSPMLSAEVDITSLSRVPSYTTAVRAGTRNLSDPTTLPQYEVDIRSAPISPQNSPPNSVHGFSSRLMAVQRNSTAGVARGHLVGSRSEGPSTPRASTDLGQRSHSTVHLHSLSDFLEGLRSG